MDITVAEAVLERVPCYMMGFDNKVRIYSLVDLRLALEWDTEILVELPVTIH